MQTPIHTPDESAVALGAFFCLVWLVILIWWLVAKSRVVADTVAWFRRKGVPARIFIVCAFLAVLTYGSVKSGGNEPQNQPRPPLLLQVMEPAPEPAIVPMTVHTNGVALRVESMNAVEVTAFRTVGGTELGDWERKFPRQRRHLTKWVAEEIVAAGEDCRAMNQASGMRRAEGPSLHA